MAVVVQAQINLYPVNFAGEAPVAYGVTQAG